MTIKKWGLGVLTLTAATLPIISVVSCSSSGESTPRANPDHPELGWGSLLNQKDRTFEFNTVDSGYEIIDLLKDVSYNSLYDEMMKTPNTVSIVVIAQHKAYSDIVKINPGETVLQAMDDSRFIFKRKNFAGLGEFIHTFAIRPKNNVFLSGTRTTKSSGDYYPMYYINHKSSQLGVSNYHLKGHEMLEFSYDIE